MNQPFPMEFLVIPLVFSFVIVLLILAAIDRWRRENHRLELQKSILERVGSVKDLGEFLTTEQGNVSWAPWRRRSFVHSCAASRP